MDNYPAAALTIGMQVVKSGPYLDGTASVVDNETTEEIPGPVVGHHITADRQILLHHKGVTVKMFTKQGEVGIGKRTAPLQVAGAERTETVVATSNGQHSRQNTYENLFHNAKN